MSGSHLTVRPERCTQCGRCVPACPEGAIKVGPSYIYVDEKRCTMCFACVDACEPGAVSLSVAPARGSGARASVPVGDVPKVVVGSRAEAKALRKAAAHAEKGRGKPPKSAAQPARVQATPSPRSGAAAAPKPLAKRGAASDAASAPRPAAAARSIGGPPPGAAHWSLADAGIVLALMLVAVLGKDRVLGLHAVSLMPDAGKTLVRAAVLGVYYSIQLGLFAWLASRHGKGLLAAFGLSGQPATSGANGSAPGDDLRAAGGSFGLVLLLFVGTEAFAVAYELAMQVVGLSQPARLSSDLTAVFGGGGMGMVLSTLLVALVAPFVEELAFRGILLPVAGERISAWPAIVLTAAIYAAFHLNLWLFVPTMVLGIALGWLAWTRRSLWPAIALHVLYNAAAVAASFALSRLVH